MHHYQSSDRPTLLLALLLLLAGIAFVYSASAEFAAIRLGSAEHLLANHVVRVLISIVVMLLLARIDYHIMQQLSRPILVLSVVLLVFVLVQGTQLKGAVRWLDIAGLSFQPSELAKFALMLHLAVRMDQLDTQLWNWKQGLLPLLGWIGTVCTLIALQPNLSTAVLVFVIAMMLLFVGGARIAQLAVVSIVGLVIAGIYAVGAEYRIQRLEHYLGTGTSTESYQLQQALIGYAHGGILGVGSGQSRQRDLFLPESYGDFIAAIVGEEYGLLGMLFLLACYGALVLRGVIIARRAPDTLGYLLAWGIVLVLGWYALINIAVSCGLLPTTGIPLPLISYGGSSIVFTAAALGILLNISRQGGNANA
jgi:cell division protein FtsW